MPLSKKHNPILAHKDVDDDLQSIGPAAARRIIQTINGKLTHIGAKNCIAGSCCLVQTNPDSSDKAADYYRR